METIVYDRMARDILGLDSDGGKWIDHSESLLSLSNSSFLLGEAAHEKRLIDVITWDGCRIDRVHPNDAKLLVSYNIHVTPPASGVRYWRLSDVAYTSPLVDDQDACFQEEPAPNKYRRKIKTVSTFDCHGNPVKLDIYVDVYDVIEAFSPMGSALQHAVKKVLCAGQRGHKDRLQDLNDIIASVKREIEMQEDKGE